MLCCQFSKLLVMGGLISVECTLEILAFFHVMTEMLRNRDTSLDEMSMDNFLLS